MALRALWAFKLQSIFSMTGVALGVTAIVIIVAAVDGAQQRAFTMAEHFGPDALLIFGGSQRSRALGQRTNTLTWEDMEALRSAFPTAYLVVPMSADRDVPLRFGRDSYRVSRVIGTTEGYAAAWNWPIVAGNDFREDDIRFARNVCLLANEPRKYLFQDEYPIGKYILVKDIPCRVIGILAERGFTGGGGNADDRIIMPISTVNRKLLNERRYVRAIRMKFEDLENMEAHTKGVREVLRREHRIASEEDEDFRVLSAQEVLKFLKMLTGSLVIFLGVTAGVGMIVGGVVLANLFYVGIQERRQEIGIKRALGAPQGAIYWQFLLEALITTGLGGVAGILLGIGVSKILSRLDLFVTVVSWKLFVIALCSAFIVGLIFGVKPAKQASQLDPILAIRS